MRAAPSCDVGGVGVEHRPHRARDLRRVQRVGVVELRERGADDEVAEQPRVRQRVVRLGEQLRLALGVADVEHDERLEVAAQRQRPLDRRLDLVEAEVEARLARPLRVEVRDAELARRR